jgi:hypothetical protein
MNQIKKQSYRVSEYEVINNLENQLYSRINNKYSRKVCGQIHNLAVDVVRNQVWEQVGNIVKTEYENTGNR